MTLMIHRLIKKFLVKGGDSGYGTNLWKKLQETGMMVRRSGSIESIQSISCFSVM